VEVERQPSVLMGDFGEVAGLGIRELLSEEGLVLSTQNGSHERLLSRMRDERPDVLLLDLDRERVGTAARAVAEEFPAVTVIACSSEDARMVVFPAHGGAPEEQRLTPERLVNAVRSA
jgi:DNA-binding NarL/FixJ family response regulator